MLCATAAPGTVDAMGWTDRLPPRPAHRHVALGVTIAVFAHGVLLTLYFFLGDVQDGTPGTLVPRIIDQLTGSHIPHAGCVRAFLRLWREDPATALRGYEACRVYGFDPKAAPPSL